MAIDAADLTTSRAAAPLGADAAEAPEVDQVSDGPVDEVLVEEISIDGMCGVY